MAKAENVDFETGLELEQVKGIFSSYLASLSRKVEFGPIESSDNPFDTPSDFSAFASLSTFAGGWIVQIYIQDRGSRREVTLVALGSGAMGRAFLGMRNTVSIGRSRAIVMEILEQFKNADSSMALT